MKSIAASTACGTAKSRQERPGLRLLGASLAVIAILPTGCGNSSSSTTKTNPTPPTPNVSQLYFSAGMGSDTLATYAIDHTAETFVRSTYNSAGATITDAGSISSLTGAIVGFNATYVNGNQGSVTLQNPVTGGWAVELPDQAALVELNTPDIVVSPDYTIPATSYFAPAVPTQSCPDLTTPETFQFVTLPERLAPAGATGVSFGVWDPQLETAYGSVQIATSGTSVQFSSVSQFTLPSANGGTPGTPATPAAATATGECATTFYGQVISVPSTDTVTNPGGTQGVSPSATVGIGPSGFLVEDAGSSPIAGEPYDNVLGAGYGAIGLPPPATDITSSLAGGRYQGFLYSPGVAPAAFDFISSFGGYSNQQMSCAALLGQLAAADLNPSSNAIYGGEFTIDDATPNPAGMGNCDVAVDLGTQSGSGNGLYTSVTVYVGSGFPENGLGTPYSFPAVAVAGQLQGKNAIFLVGVDTTGTPVRAWGIYLLQSN